MKWVSRITILVFFSAGLSQQGCADTSFAPTQTQHAPTTASAPQVRSLQPPVTPASSAATRLRVHQATRAPILAKHLWEIAGEATFIGVVDVSEVRGWLGSTGTAHNEVIYSDVRFTALTVLKDSTQLVKDGSFTLSVLGGRFGNRSMRASGVPTLQRGERLIIIAHANAPDIPTYGGTRGVLRVIDNRVYSYVGMPVVGIDDYGISVLPRCDRIRYNRALLPVPTGDASGRPVPPLCAGQDEALSLDVAIRALRDVAGGHP